MCPTVRHLLPALLLSLSLPAALHAQEVPAGAGSATLHSEAGRPFLTCHSQKAYAGHSQNWVFVQDERGVLYAGNGLGVLEYDGVSWRLLETATRTVVRGLSLDAEGRIYVGSFADVGYLAPDDTGQLRYASLLAYIPEDDQTFNDIWTVHATPEGIYFQARERIFRFTPSGDQWQVKVWRPEGRFLFAFWLDDTYYVHQGGMGLMRMAGDSLQLLPGGEQFANERLQVMLPYGDGKILVGPFNRGLFLYDGRTFEPFQTEADAFLRSNTLYKGALLSDVAFGLITLDGGFVSVDRSGRLLQHVDRAAGLPSNVITSLFVDHQGLVWLGSEGGICQAETPSPLSLYDAASGMIGGATDILRYKGILYVTTGNGVFYLDAGTATFRQVSGVADGNPQSWSLLSVEDRLLASTGSGIYEIEGTTALVVKRNVGSTYDAGFLHQSRQDERRVFVALFDGLASLRLDASGRWIDEGRIAGIHEYLLQIVEPEPGTLWMGTQSEVIRIRFDGPSLQQPLIERFGVEHGLPDKAGTSVFEVAGKVVFTAKEGVYGFDEASGRFLPDSLLSVVSFGGSPDEHSIAEDHQGNIWVNFGRETAVLRRQAEGSYRVDKTALLRFADIAAASIYPEDDGVVWLGSIASLIRYDPGVAKEYAADYPALIRRVTAGEDSVLFGGTPAAGVQTGPLELAYQHNSLRFEFAATSYDNAFDNHFQSMLEGFDAHWSAWTKEYRRDYTNLPPGDYRFRVHARNIYEHESTEAVYAFTILPPWYRTWWAYAVYALLFGLAVFGADRVQRRRLLKQERARAHLRETELRAEAENERRKNVELLSKIGRDITGTLSIEAIIDTVYENVNALMDASVFGIGLYNETEQCIDFPATKEKGSTLPPYAHYLDDTNRITVRCFTHQEEIVIADYAGEYQRYVEAAPAPVEGDDASSILYLPLVHLDKTIGVITTQSFQKNAYSDYHLNILRNLATYTAIALDNADAYRRLNATFDELGESYKQNEELLLNILPEPIALRLKQGEGTIADAFPEVTVLFADLVGFTLLSLKTTAAELVALLNDLFSAYDTLTQRLGVEKIKTIGDSYMAVCGLPEPTPDHAELMAEMALGMLAATERFNAVHGTALRLRIGLNTGPVVAGVIGTHKFIYDLWGDAVNTAARMESHGVPDRVHVTAATYRKLQDTYRFESRGEIEVKGKGRMQTYLLLARKKEAVPV